MLFHRHPFDDVMRFERDVDHLFRRAFPVGRSQTSTPAAPLAILPDAGGVTVRAELPGVDPAAIAVSVDGRLLTIQAERQAMHPEGGRAHLQERSHRRLTHAFSLADDLDAEAISAKAEHGVLTIRIPKRTEAKPRHIPVQPS